MQTNLKITKESVLELFDKQDYIALRALFKEVEDADIAEIFSQSPISKSIHLFRLVPRLRRIEVFSHLELERQEEFVEELPELLVTYLLNEMEPDDRTRLLERLPEEIRDKTLAQLDPEARQVAWKLLSYPESSVGRLMTPDLITLDSSMTVKEAFQKIRWTKTLSDEYLNHLFVVNKNRELIGEVSLTSLVSADPLTVPVSDIMKTTLVTLSPMDDETRAVEVLRKYDRNSFPVVDEKNKLLGFVTGDDVFDVAEEEATEDIQQFGGQGALEDSYFQTPLFTMVQKRAGWLSVLFIGGFISCATLKLYEEAISQWSFLIFFLPIVSAAGGNSGTQAASLIIRGLSIKEFSQADAWRVLSREVWIGFVLGLILALIGFFRSYTWGMETKIGIVLGISVWILVLFGAMAGSMLPFVFKKIKLDPAVVSSPFISTLMDVTGIVIYINVALFIMTRVV